MTLYVYGKPNCVQCTFTKKYLDENDIPYKYIDATESETTINDLRANGYQSFPVVAYDNRLGHEDLSHTGFQPGELKRLSELVES